MPSTEISGTCALSTAPGKFCEADFEETKRALEVEAAKVLAEMDELTDGPSTAARRQAAPERQNS
ncbi:MAG TPA: hypothetical protein VMG82_00220 [Candidatus Sulfotelmatobacter sp.]|nr:hypothetical protein [Candidatus Sulfotelmatobacter sp.]